MSRIDELVRQRDALLKALKALYDVLLRVDENDTPYGTTQAMLAADTAIRNAEATRHGR